MSCRKLGSWATGTFLSFVIAGTAAAAEEDAPAIDPKQDSGVRRIDAPAAKAPPADPKRILDIRRLDGTVAKAPAADAVAAVRGRNNAAEEKIRKALDDVTVFEFIDTPLKDVIDYLQDLHSVPFVIDRKMIEGAGGGIDSPITLRVKGIKLRSALNLLLKQIDGNLAWIVRDEVLYITTRDEANAHSVIRVYNVHDLLGNAEAGRTGPTLDEFVGTLKAAVEKDTWDDNGGSGTVQQYDVDGVLIVTQNATAHEAIESLLEQLRESRPTSPGK